jgi:hypothetical protein
MLAPSQRTGKPYSPCTVKLKVNRAPAGKCGTVVFSAPRSGWIFQYAIEASGGITTLIVEAGLECQYIFADRNVDKVH